MKATKQGLKHYTFEEYLELEQKDQLRYQYYNGEIFVLAGGTKRHNMIARNVGFEINLQKPDCETYLNDVKLELQAKNYYVYPDVMLTCDEGDLRDDKESIVKNPVLLVEVLSDTTAAYDANEKKRCYFSLSSLQYYILISQDRPLVEIYEREQKFWKYTSFESLDDSITLIKLNINIKLSDIYKKIDFVGKGEGL